MMTEFSNQFDESTRNKIMSNPVLPQDVSEEAVPGNIRKAGSFVLTLAKFTEYIKRKLKIQHVVIESPSFFLRELYKDILLDKRTLKFFHDSITQLLQTLEISDLSQYQPIIKIASLATLASTYSEGFVIITEPFDSKTNLYDPKIYFSCLDASLSMKPVFERFQSVIVTSGVISILS